MSTFENKQLLLTYLCSSDTSSDDEDELEILFKMLAEQLSSSVMKRRRKQRCKRLRLQSKLKKQSCNDVEDVGKSYTHLEPSKQEGALLRQDHEVSTYLIEHWESVDDEEFRKLFRMRKESFQKLLNLEEFLNMAEKNPEISNEEKRSKAMLIFLLFAGDTMSLKTLAQNIEINLNSCLIYINFAIEMLLFLAPEKLRLPESLLEKQESADDFYNIAGLKDIIGCVEKLNVQYLACTRSRMQQRSSASSTSSANNFTVELACNANGSLLAFDHETLDSKLAAVCGTRFCFLASDKFSLREWAITPYNVSSKQQMEQQQQLTVDQRLFNEKYAATYVVMSRSLCQLQQRFQQLLCIDAARLTFARRFLHACCVLHNVLMDCNDYWQILEDNIVATSAELNVDEEAMLPAKKHYEFDRFNCPRGIEKRKRMTCIQGDINIVEQEIL